jgi:putative transposase
MKARRFTEAQIIAILKECEAGASGKEICRRHGISEQTLYRWKAKFGGMQVSDARRLKQLERENARLKRLAADLTLDRESLQELLGKNW